LRLLVLVKLKRSLGQFDLPVRSRTTPVPNDRKEPNLPAHHAVCEWPLCAQRPLIIANRTENRPPEFALVGRDSQIRKPSATCPREILAPIAIGQMPSARNRPELLTFPRRLAA